MPKWRDHALRVAGREVYHARGVVAPYDGNSRASSAC